VNLYKLDYLEFNRKSYLATSKSSPKKKKTTATTTKASKSKSKKTPTTRSTRTKSTRRKTRAKSTKKSNVETCEQDFVPKFNPNSTTNQVPMYHLIRRAFGNMVRESICQLDKNNTGVSSQQIVDHILKHYSFPNDIPEGVIQNRTMFTINSGLRAGTLARTGANKGVRIGRRRRYRPHLER